MNMKKIILLSTISFGLINSLQAQYTSKVVMKEGQVITAEVSMNMTATQTMQDQPMEMKTDAVSIQTFKVIGMSETGYTLLSTLTKMKLNFDGFGQKQEYDSENKEKQSGMLAGPLNEKINKSDTENSTKTEIVISDTTKIVTNTAYNIEKVVNDFYIEPVDSTKALVIIDSNGKKTSYHNAKIRHRAEISRNKTLKSEIVQKSHKENIKATTQAKTSVKQIERKTSFISDFWWLWLILLLILLYYLNKKLNLFL